MATMAVFYRGLMAMGYVSTGMDGLPLQCTTPVSDGFAFALGHRNTFGPCFFLSPDFQSRIVAWHDEYLFHH